MTTTTDSPTTDDFPLLPEVPTDERSDEEGGRLWKLAGEEATTRLQTASYNNTLSTPPRIFSSRADLDARPLPKTTTSLVETTAKTASRPAAVSGMLTLLVGWLGNFWAATSCDLARKQVEIGYSSELLTLKYGLWKYTSVDVAADGGHCTPYHGSHSPWVPRLASVAAWVLGTGSLGIVWWYWIVGPVPYLHWAYRLAIAAGVLQLSTLFLLASPVARPATPGLAMIWVLVTTLAWWALAWELRPQQRPEADEDVELTSRREAYEPPTTLP